MQLSKLFTKLFIAILIAAIVFFVAVGFFIFNYPRGSESRCSSCNIILISVDTFGAKHLGLYGYDRPTSPLLDRHASERGIVFENAFVQASWTLPSHTAMLTGRYSGELGVWLPLDKLPERANTIAEAMKERGFKTQVFSDGLFVQPEWGFDQGFDGFEGKLAPEYWKDSPKIFRDALSWLTANRKKPFFLFLRPFHMNGGGGLYTEEALKEIGVEADGDRQSISVQDIITANSRPTGPTKEENDRFRDIYDVKVREIDKGLAEFFQGLDNLGLAKNTVVILVADHGEEFGEHGTTRFHAALYDETIHVPLIIFLPGAKARRISNIVEVRSIPATILDILGLKSEPSFIGPSLAPLLRGNNEKRTALSATAADHEWFFKRDADNKTNLEKTLPKLLQIGKTIFPKERTEDFNEPYATSAISAHWHLIRNKDDSFELYNRDSDYAEQSNRFAERDTFSSDDKEEINQLLRALNNLTPGI